MLLSFSTHGLCRKDVALAPTSLDGCRFTTVIKLCTKPLRVNINNVRERIEVFVPNMFGDLSTSGQLAGTQYEQLQHGEIFFCRIQRSA